jgi:hypothetical protein
MQEDSLFINYLEIIGRTLMATLTLALGLEPFAAYFAISDDSI